MHSSTGFNLERLQLQNPFFSHYVCASYALIYMYRNSCSAGAGNCITSKLLCIVNVSRLRIVEALNDSSGLRKVLYHIRLKAWLPTIRTMIKRFRGKRDKFCVMAYQKK